MIRILIVDDLNIVREGIRAILESKPELKIVGTTQDGKSAIEQIAVLQPDIAIVDIEMPVMDGIVATQKICQQFPETKVLILSSHENHQYILEALQAGASGYLLKSTLAENLEEAIWSVYRGHSQIESKLLRELLSTATVSQPRVLVEKNGSISTGELTLPDNLEKESVDQSQTNDYRDGYTNSRQDLSSRSSIASFLKNPWLIALGILGLLVMSGSVIYGLNLVNRQTEATATEETQKPVWEGVTALGRIEPEGEAIALSPPPNMGGSRIGKLMVKEGERVVQGQEIAFLDNRAVQQAALEVAQQEVEVARIDLAIIKAGAKTGDIEAQKAVGARLEAELVGKNKAQKATIARLEAQLHRETEAQSANKTRSQAEFNNAQADFQRYQQLARDGAISTSELDSRRLTLETARESVKEAKANYDRTQDTLEEEIKEARATNEETQNRLARQIQEARANLASISEVRPLDVQKATAELDRAIANFQQAQQDLELTSVKSPIDGQVLRINAYPGEMVSQDEGVVELGKTDRMVVIAEIYESDIGQINLGQQATIISEGGAFADELQGTVTYIRPQIRQQDIFDTDPAADIDTRIIEVKIALDSSSSQKVAQFTNSKVIVKIQSNNF
jgi:HlyD family secretion protein